MALIECVPNVSDGRRLDVIDALAAAIMAVDGVHLLDRSSDPTHNRSVFTFAGEADPLRQAVLALFDGAIRAIDLRSHRGAHPRLGAVDVVPFIPISGATMPDCVALARATAAEVADALPTTGVSVRGGCLDRRAAQPGRHPARRVRRARPEDGVAGMGARTSARPDPIQPQARR